MKDFYHQILDRSGAVIKQCTPDQTLAPAFLVRNKDARWGDHYCGVKRKRDAETLVMKSKSSGETLIRVPA